MPFIKLFWFQSFILFISSYFFINLDTRDGTCFRSYTEKKCEMPFPGVSKKEKCCCSVGKAWGTPCEICPLRGTRKY